MPDRELREQIKGIFAEEIKNALESMRAEMKAEMKPEPVEKVAPSVITGGTNRLGEHAEKYILGSILRIASIAKGNRRSAMELATKHYGERHKTINILATTPAEAGGVMVPIERGGEFFEALREDSVVRQAGPHSVNMPYGNFQINGIVSGATASYAGETEVIPLSESKFGSNSLVAKSIKVLIPVSNDLLSFSVGGTEQLIQADAVGAIAERSDKGFLLDDGTLKTPVGLLNLAHSGNKFNANSTVNVANVCNDLATAELKIRNGLKRTMKRPAWFISPRTMLYLRELMSGNSFVFKNEMAEKRTINGIPFFETSQIVDNLGSGTNESTIILADMSHILLGESNGIDITMSEHATITDGSNLAHAFQQDFSVIRGKTFHDIMARYDKAIAVINKVKWGA